MTPNWPTMISPDGEAEATIHFRPPRRRYTQPSALMTLSRFAPMIDMSFLLLIFFMTTTRFAHPEGLFTSQMPREAGVHPGGSVADLPLTPIVVRLVQTGQGHDDFTLAIDNFPGAAANGRELAQALRQIHQQPGFDVDTPVVIVAGRDVRWDHVVDCWNAALSAGCRRVAFGEE